MNTPSTISQIVNNCDARRVPLSAKKENSGKVVSLIMVQTELWTTLIIICMKGFIFSSLKMAQLRWLMESLPSTGQW